MDKRTAMAIERAAQATNDRPRKLSQRAWRRVGASRNDSGTYERVPDWQTPEYAIRNRQPFDASHLHGRTGSHGAGWASNDLSNAERESLAAADYVVLSYDTPIAWHDVLGWKMPNLRYSLTTSQHQSTVRVAIGATMDWQHNRRAKISNLGVDGQGIPREGW